MRGTHARFLQALTVLAFIGTCSATMGAQQSTGSLRLLAGEDVAGQVRLDVSSDGDPGRRRSATIDAAHPATMGGLPPGPSRVTATWPGGATISLAIDLAAAEVVQLKASGPSTPGAAGILTLIDRHPEGHVTNLGPRDLRVLPSGGSVDALVETAAPFVVVDAIDSGGLQSAQSRLTGSRGASGRQSRMLIGDIELMQRPGSGVTALTPDLNMLQEFVVSGGHARPDLTAPGASVTLVPRRSGDRLAGALSASFTGARFVSANATTTAPSVESLQYLAQVDAGVGGPIAQRGGLFVSESVTRAQKVAAGGSAEIPIRVTSTFAHAVSNVAARDQVRLLTVIQALEHEFDGRAQFADRIATERDHLLHVQGVWSHQRDDGSRSEAGLAFQHGSFTPSLSSTAGGVLDRIVDGPMPPAAAASTATRFDARLLFEPRERRGPAGSHALQFGVIASRSTSGAHIEAAPPVAEIVGGLPARVWVRTLPGADSERHVTAVSAYVADRIAASSHFTLDLGIGVGSSSGSAGTSASQASWVTMQPRAAFRWVPKGLALFGGYSLYQPDLMLDHLAFGDPGEAAVQVYRWNDGNANQRLDPGETSETLIARAGRGPDVASIDPALRAPRTHELALGLERQLTRTSVLRAVATVRYEHDVARSVNVGVPDSGYAARQLPDQGGDYLSTTDDRPLTVYDRLPSSFGQDRFVLMNAPGRVYYGGIELTYILRAKRWSSMFGAMVYHTDGAGGNRGFRASENDQGVLGEVLENPNAASYAEGRLFFDRAYVGKWTTAYQATNDLSIAVVARYQDGQPFSRFVAASGLAQGPEYVSAYHNGRTRFTFTATADLRVEQRFRLGSQRASVRLDVFNLSNDANEVEENPVTGPAFRQSTLLQPPRTVRLGFGFEF